MASACVLGVPAERLVYGDALERVFWLRVTARAVELDGTRRDNQAIQNANKIGEVLKKMFSRTGRR